MTPRSPSTKILSCLSVLAFAAALALPSAMLFAEDLEDNDGCLECHSGEEVTGSIENPGKAVHTTAGEFHIEDHEMWACIDCHTDIEEVPHKEDVTRTVDCLACHDEVIK